jgi:hypothetical protein
VNIVTNTINLDNVKSSSIRLYRNTEYILNSSSLIFVSTNKNYIVPFSKISDNGTNSVTYNIAPNEANIDLWIFVSDRIISVTIEYADRTLALTLEDFIPAYISDEYPLFKKLIEYYFLYTGAEYKPSDLIHNLEKYANIDTTFDEFKDYIFKEVLSDFPSDMAVDKTILSKYILEFYAERGTEDSFRFLFRVLYNLEIDFTSQRKRYLISSDNVQGILDDSTIVLQDNYLTMLFSYIIDVNIPFYQWKDLLYKMVNPSGYLPFGRSTTFYSGWDNNYSNECSYALEDRSYYPSARYVGIPMAINRDLVTIVPNGNSEILEINNFFVKALSS